MQQRVLRVVFLAEDSLGAVFGLRPAAESRAATRRRASRIAPWRETSLCRGPVLEFALGALGRGFLKEEIELSRGGIGFHLLVPSAVLHVVKPSRQLPKFLFRKIGDGGLYFHDRAHACEPNPTEPSIQGQGSG